MCASSGIGTGRSTCTSTASGVIGGVGGDTGACTCHNGVQARLRSARIAPPIPRGRRSLRVPNSCPETLVDWSSRPVSDSPDLAVAIEAARRRGMRILLGCDPLLNEERILSPTTVRPLLPETLVSSLGLPEAKAAAAVVVSKHS